MDAAGDTGEWPTLLVGEGRPTISYFKRSTNDLMYVRASDLSGCFWASRITVDGGANGGAYSHPQMYVHANDASGTSWGTPVVVHKGYCAGGTCSLAEVNGRPAIAYHHDYAHDLQFAMPRRD